MRLGEAIVAYWDAQSPALATLYNGWLPAGVTYPAVTYSRVTTSQDVLLAGKDTLTDVWIQFDVWGDDMASVADTADTLRILFNGYQGAMGDLDIQYCRFNGENDTHEIHGDYVKYRISVDFVFTLHENSEPIVTIDQLLTNDASPELTGTVSNSAVSVVVTVDGSDYAATINGDGTWTLAGGTITPDLEGGTYTIPVTATDAGGQVGIDPGTDALTIDGDGILFVFADGADSAQFVFADGADDVEFIIPD